LPFPSADLTRAAEADNLPIARLAGRCVLRGRRSGFMATQAMGFSGILDSGKPSVKQAKHLQSGRDARN
jgi:hypothetical protein